MSISLCVTLLHMNISSMFVAEKGNKPQYFLKLGHFCDICILQYDYRK